MIIAVFDAIQSVAGVPYHKAEYNADILDTVVLRRAKEKGIRLPTGEAPDCWNYFGATVFQPRAGLNHNVMYLDLASLYPNLMRALNVGPDTIVGTQEDLNNSEYTEEDCYWSYIDPREVYHLDKGESYRDFTDGTYKMVYDPHANGSKMKWKDDPVMQRCYYLKPSVKEGFLRGTVQELIDLKYQYEGTMYEAVKRIVNSIYGYNAYLTQNTSSRLADWRIGESITLAGRKVIQYSARKAVEMLSQRVDGEVYIAIGDTDGAGLCWPQAPTRDVMADHVEDIVEYLNGPGYENFMEDTFGIDETDHYQEIENESYAPSLFVPQDFDATSAQLKEHLEYSNGGGNDVSVGVKKRYAQWITIDEGDEVDDLKFTGLEAVRSDVANVTQEAQKQILTWLLKEDFGAAWKQIAPYLRDLHNQISSGEYELSDIAKRGGIRKPVEEYGSATHTPQPIYRGAKYADQHFDGVTIKAGSKPLTYYVKSVGDYPSTYTADTAEDGKVVDTVAVEEPRDLPDDIVIDYEKHCTKTLVEPLRPILKTIGKDFDEVLYGHKQVGFNEFASGAT